MNYKKVTAIIRTVTLSEVEERLKKIGVKGMTTFYVLGYGEYTPDFVFPSEEFCGHMRVEIWANEEKVEEIVRTIIATCHTGMPGDGMVSVVPVDKVWRIRTKQEPTAHEI